MSNNTATPVRTVSEMLPGNTAQTAAANAFARALLSPQPMLNSVGAQVNLCTLLLSASGYAPYGKKKKSPKRRGVTLLVRPMRPRPRNPRGPLAAKPPVPPRDAGKDAPGERGDVRPLLPGQGDRST